MGRMDLTEYDLRRWAVEAEQGFERARRHAFLESITALLRGRPDDLLSFDEVQLGDEIMRSAVDMGANLLILGDTGYSPFVELFARSTLDQVLREATCPVLVVG